VTVRTSPAHDNELVTSEYDGLPIGPRPAGAGGGQVWRPSRVTSLDDRARRALVRRGFALEWATLSWNVAGIVVLALAAAGRD
jgi:hypothetical protein